MRKERLIKIFTFKIVVLFVCFSFVSAFNVNLVKQYASINRNNWFYVGGSGPGNYSSIQDAIDNASNGDTVFVYSGIYYENVFVNKSLTLRGEDKNTTIIDGSGDVGFNISCNETFINDFTINNCIFGISLLYNIFEVSNIAISNNLIYDCGHGILFVNSNSTYILSNTIFNNLGNSVFIQKCNNSNISNNVFYNNSQNGITIKSSSNCIIFSNDIYNNLDLGISIIDSSQNNSIFINNINNNSNKGIYVEEFSFNNSFYHNNLWNNTLNAYDEGSNYWDDGYPSGGNYWDDYSGADNNHGPNQDIPGSDSIGDTPYDLPCEHAVDKYPFMHPNGWLNNPPNKPSRPSGQTQGKVGILYTYTTNTIDPDGDQIYYKWSWGDDSYSEWLGPYDSGKQISDSHAWSKGIYEIKVKAKDLYSFESDWSDPLAVGMLRNRAIDNSFLMFFKNYSLLFKMLQLLFKGL